MSVHAGASSDYRADIDGLRALAIVAVVMFHAFPTLLPGGFVGVDVFFVISGYLITSIIRDAEAQRRFSFGHFYWKRARRLFPALALVLVAVLGFGGRVLLAEEFAQLGKHVAASAAFSTNLVLWTESGYFDNAAETKPLLHLWSLGIEEQFYLAWPVVLVLLLRRTRNPFAVTCAFAIVSLLAGVATTTTDATQAFFSPVMRAWELLLGALVALRSNDCRAPWSRIPVLSTALPTTGLIAVAGGAALLHQGLAFPGAWALVPTLGACALIAAGPGAWISRNVLALPLLTYVGRASYAIYLWHWPLLSFARILTGGTPDAEVRLGLVAASVALGALTYEMVERPVRFGRWQRGGVAISCAAVLAAGFAGLLVYGNNGLPGRAASEVNASIDPAIRQYALRATVPDHVAVLMADRQRAIRSPTCHMNRAGETFASYLPTFRECLRTSSTKPNVLVLGDSHGADLYVALADAYGETHQILQATGAGCSPEHSMGGATTPCALMHQHAIRVAVENRVAAVVIAARWSHLRPEQLRSLIRELQGSSQVYLVGPPASFTADVSKLVARGRLTRTQRSISTTYFDRTVLDENTQLAAIARESGIRYVDRIATQCGAALACPLVTADGSLLIFDYGHLTRVGSSDLGKRLRAGGLAFPQAQRP